MSSDNGRRSVVVPSHTHHTTTTPPPTPPTPPTPPPNAPGLTRDQQALVHHLRGYGFVGAVGFVRRVPNWAVWDALVEVDMMGEEERAQIRSLGALIRYLVGQACRE